MFMGANRRDDGNDERKSTAPIQYQGALNTNSATVPGYSSTTIGTVPVSCCTVRYARYAEYCTGRRVVLLYLVLL